jgi:hypothetical protein
MTFGRRVTICLLMALSKAYCQSDISLDKLSDCTGLASIRANLDHPISSTCRSPRTNLERIMMAQFSGVSGIRACLLSINPTARLANFACVDQTYKGTRELSCFREVDNAILSDYVHRYESGYSARETKYLDAAALCQVGNGDAIAAKSSLFPPTLKAIASAGFGYVLGLGKGHVTPSRAYHGYAETDPEIHGTSGAVEVFDAVNIPGGKLEVQEIAMVNREPTLDFTISKLDATETRETLRSMYRLPVSAEVRAFDFKYKGVQNVPFQTRADDLESWKKGIAKILVAAGYREYLESEYNTMGLSKEEVRERLVKGLKFGDRKMAAERFGPFSMLFRDAPGDCANVVDLLVFEPEKNVKEDYGTIAMVLIDAGHCGNNSRPDRLINDAVDYLRKETNDR